MKYLSFFQSRLPSLTAPNERGESLALCPFHPNSGSPALSVNVDKGLWKCFNPSCIGHRGGGHKKFDLYLHGEVSDVEAKGEPIAVEAIEGMHAVLLANKEKMDWLRDVRLYTNETIAKFKLGWDSDRIWIPIREDGQYINVRKYKPGATSDKVISYSLGHGAPRLFPEENWKHQTIYIFEGETDCILATQLGLPAVTVSGGSGSWHDSFTSLLKDKDVILVYDVDEAGQKGSASVALRILSSAKGVSKIVLPLPGTKGAKDFSDYIKQGHTLEDFNQLPRVPIVPIVSASSRPPDELIDIHLSQVGLEGLVGKRIQSTVLIAGKDLAPFQVPKCISYQCTGGEKICGRCGISKAGLQLEVEVPEWSPDLLKMVNVPSEKLDGVIADLASVPGNCRRFQYQVKEYANIEMVKAIPEIDFNNDASEYVIRQLFYLGHGLKSNHTFEVKAVVMPEPKTQYATALIYEVKDSQDNLETFQVTEELVTLLAVFHAV